MQQVSEMIMSVIETTPLLYQFLLICFFIGRFSNAVLHYNLNWQRSLICSLKNMDEKFTGGQIAIVNEGNVK